MNNSYIAGFFDGEGCAMVLTIKRRLKSGTLFRFRPTIKIAQKQPKVLYRIREFLGFGTIIGRKGVFSLQINGLDKVLKFIQEIALSSVVKQKQLYLLQELATFQKNNLANHPYSKDDLLLMIALRDSIFALNCLSRKNLKQKYPKEIILAEHSFVNITRWQKSRHHNRIAALVKKITVNIVPNTLSNLYFKQNLSMREIGRRLGHSHHTISNHLKKLKEDINAKNQDRVG